MAVMSRMGNFDVLEELNGTKVHRLENILTLQLDVHQFFDGLVLWFEPTVS
jgi:hypothetical protein